MIDSSRPTSASAAAPRSFRHFDLVMAAFVAILLLSNVLGAGKVAQVRLPGIGDWPFGAGILFFPLSYIIGDVLTEVFDWLEARVAAVVAGGVGGEHERVVPQFILPLLFRFRKRVSANLPAERAATSTSHRILRPPQITPSLMLPTVAT